MYEPKIVDSLQKKLKKND